MMLKSPSDITTVCILGAGTMGQSIARLLSQNGIRINLYDPDHAIRHKLSNQAWLSNDIVLRNQLKPAVTGADVIIESIPEVLSLKRDTYLQITPYLAPHAIVASNTSSYSLDVLSNGLAFKDRFILLHFFNPADLVPLVEIVKPKAMQDRVIAHLIKLLKACGKKPVVLQKDIRGLIANRLQAALLREACNLVQQGIASSSDIDIAVKESIGLRWALNGPFEITDLGGLDVWGKVLENILPDLDNTIAVPDAISMRIANNELGVKVGKGFYEYGAEDSNARNLTSSQRKNLTRIIMKKEE